MGKADSQSEDGKGGKDRGFHRNPPTQSDEMSGFNEQLGAVSAESNMARL
jgi:hypothetical protein